MREQLKMGSGNNAVGGEAEEGAPCQSPRRPGARALSEPRYFLCAVPM